MAKRRSLDIPSAADLARLEEEFQRSQAVPRPGVAPIAQVAAETAAAIDPRPAALREEAARDKAEAEAFRDAQDRGLVLLDLATDEIEADALVRDRVTIDPEELAELQASIERNGMRLPIEVYAQPGAERPWALLSGYRRLVAVRALYGKSRDLKWTRIRAVARDPEAMGGAFAAMVEENEVRAALSHYERGRIAVIAAQRGAFANPEAAVDALFPVASKAKRSKIRSFALIFEELGDMLKFPDALREKDGLRLAQALREGGEARLRAGLDEENPGTPEAESLLINRLIDRLEPSARDPRKGGRPAREIGPKAVTRSGIRIEAQEDAKGWLIRVGASGQLDRDTVETLVQDLHRLLDR